MNKIISLMIILLGIVQTTFAHPEFKDDNEVYNYWAKRGIIEAIYAYMQDYKSTVGAINK